MIIYGYDFHETGDLEGFKLFTSKAKARSELFRELSELTDQNIIDRTLHYITRSAISNITRTLVAQEDQVVLEIDFTNTYSNKPPNIVHGGIEYTAKGPFDREERIKGVHVASIPIEQCDCFVE